MARAEFLSGPGISLLLQPAQIVTMDPLRPTASAIAVRGEKIAAVGDAVAIAGLASSATLHLDCRGLIVAPGFIDAHAHLLAQAAQDRYVDCSTARSIPEIIELLRDAATSCQATSWLRAFGYHEANLIEGRHPTCFDLDRGATDRPIRLTHQSGHASVLNSAALTALSIDAATEEPFGGTIARSMDTGDPNGLFLEMEDWLSAAVRPENPEANSESIARLSDRLLAAGVTSVQDLGHRNDRRRAQHMAALVTQGVFRPRLTLATGYPAFARGDAMIARGIEPGPVKIMLNETGPEIFPPAGVLAQQVAAVHHAGRQAAIHAIGPAAISSALDAIEQSQAREGVSKPHRIEHAAVTTDELCSRVAALGTAVTSNPGFLWQSGDRYLRTVPVKDLTHLYDVAGLLRAGILVAGGSDCPIGPPEPLVGIAAACSRRTMTGRRIPGQTISQNGAIDLFTRSAAGIALQDGERGVIREGLFADLVVLEETPSGLAVRMTILGGEIVWAADGFRARVESRAPVDASHAS